MSPFLSSDVVCKVVGFASSFIFLSLSLVDCSLSVQHHSQSPYKACESSLRVLEETYTILLWVAPVLLSSVCMCLFFSSSVRLFVLSTQSLSVSSNRFTFYRSARAPNCHLKLQRIFLDSLITILISTPCSICCWVMQRGRWAVLICPEARRGCTECARLDVICARLLFPEHQSPPWTPASCATIGQCTDGGSKSYMWQRK